MGADVVHVVYGLRWEWADEALHANAELLEALEAGEDARQTSAESAGLDHWWGRVTDGGACFLLVGRIVGQLGYEHNVSVRVSAQALDDLQADVHRRLVAAGLDGEPALHLQAEFQY